MSADATRLVHGEVHLDVVTAPTGCNACVKCYFYRGRGDRDCIALRSHRPEFICFGDERQDERDVIFVVANPGEVGETRGLDGLKGGGSFNAT